MRMTSQVADAVHVPESWYECDPYLLRSKLRCAGCRDEVLPTQILGGPRRYACRSGCRMVPLPAEALETQVWRETCRRSPGLAPDTPRRHRAELIGEVFSRITVGGTVTDLVYVARTPIGAVGRRQAASPGGAG